MSYDELVKLYDIAIKEFDLAEKNFYETYKNNKEYPSYTIYLLHLKPYSDKVSEYRIMLISMQKFTLSNFDNYGDYMTINEFIESCNYGAFIDYDGYGLLCIGNQKTNINIYPSDIKHNPDLSRFDGVMWYNK